MIVVKTAEQEKVSAITTAFSGTLCQCTMERQHLKTVSTNIYVT